MPQLLRHIFGYALGIFLFLILIPFGLIELAKIDPLLKHYQSGYLVIRMIFSSPLFIIGGIFMAWSNIALFFIGKGGPTDGINIAVSPRTKKLVIVGPYRYTRNPMIFGAFCLYFAIAIFTASIVSSLVLIVFLFCVIPYLKITEEKRLLRDFGEDFLSYTKNVPVFFPRVLKKKIIED